MEASIGLEEGFPAGDMYYPHEQPRASCSGTLLRQQVITVLNYLRTVSHRVLWRIRKLEERRQLQCLADARDTTVQRPSVATDFSALQTVENSTDGLFISPPSLPSTSSKILIVTFYRQLTRYHCTCP
jgi:hypothetical protein